MDEILKKSIYAMLLVLFSTNTFSCSCNELYKPFIGGRNFQRIKISSEILLKKEKQVVSLYTDGISSQDILYDIRSLELVPVSAIQKIEKEELRAINSKQHLLL